MSYQEFLAQRKQANDGDGFKPVWTADFLYPFQRSLVEWAVRQGRGAIFADCGLGKTPMMLVWAENVRRHTGKPVLIITPLAVSFQTEAEAEKFGIEAQVSRDGSIPSYAGITITNYERLELFDTHDFGGVVCDESSAIKAFAGERRRLVTEFMRPHRYRLLCTATAAPNDYIELGTSSEALGYLGYMDMLNRFFTNKLNNSATGRYRGQVAEWRFKGHAEERFWEWVASWSRAVRKPSDLGFTDEGFDLPPLEYREHLVEAQRPPDGALFDVPAHGLREEREETRRSLHERCEAAAEALADADSAIAWCHLNDESALLAKLLGGVEIRGSDHVDAKEEKLVAFSRGEIPLLVTKPSVAGFGMNYQHVHRMSYFPSHSYEMFYQAVRRMWRFGQKNPVTVDIVTTPGGLDTLKNLKRKATAADRMFESLTAHMREATLDRSDIRRDDTHKEEMEVPTWLAS